MTRRLGGFGDDNRAGLTRTLHRISAIRNRKGEVVGLTCTETVRPAQPAARGREMGTQPWDEVGQSFWWLNEGPQPSRRGGKGGKGRYSRAA